MKGVEKASGKDDSGDFKAISHFFLVMLSSGYTDVTFTHTLYIDSHMYISVCVYLYRHTYTHTHTHTETHTDTHNSLGNRCISKTEL